MRTRTFIGLIFLIVALIVASNQTLLDAIAGGIETGGLQSGMLKESSAAKAAKDSKTQAPSSLALKGYETDKAGNLHDTIALDKRGASGTDRLVDGSGRIRLPGQLEGVDAAAPPYPATGKLLLDQTGCPVFRAGADVATILADPKVKAQYTKAVTASTDPKACLAAVNALANPSTTPKTPAVDRELAGVTRGDFTSIIVDVRMMEMLAAMAQSATPADEAAKVQP